jgi:hypothetical protein
VSGWRSRARELFLLEMGKTARKMRRRTAAVISAASNPLHGGRKSELLRIRQAQQEPGLSRGKRRRLGKRERRASKAELVKVLSKRATRDESVRRHGQMGDMSDMSSSPQSLLADLQGGASLLDATRGRMGAGAAGAAVGAAVGATAGVAAGSKNSQSTSADGSGAGGKTMSNKTRSRIAAAEADNLSMVVNHAAFQANPLAAIREHLKNTLGQ